MYFCIRIFFDMDTKTRRKIEKLKHLLFLEKEEEETFFERQFQDFSSSKIKKAIKDGLCLYPLSFKKAVCYSEEIINVTFNFQHNPEEEHAFQPTGSVKIFQADPDTGAIINIINGIVSLVSDKKIEISYSSETPFPWMEQEDGIGVHVSFNKYTYRIMEKALDDIYRACGNRLTKLRDIMLGKQKAGYMPCRRYANNWLNPAQQAAVNHILSSHDVAIIHGPPGTGKTTTLVEAIIETLKTERQVMVCAYTNIAVDVIAEKLMERSINVVRIGNPAKVTDDLLNITYETQYYEHPYYTDILSSKEKIKKLQSECSKIAKKNPKKKRELLSKITDYKYYISSMESHIKSDILNRNAVIATTMIGSSFKILNGMSFSTIFIDEAVQALEPACWVPITKAHRVVFAGDHHQLPPTIKSFEAAKLGLSHTLFEKIIERKPECSTMLTTQYRMHESIMNFSSKWFYKGRLSAADCVRHEKLFKDDIPVEWINTSICEFSEEKQSQSTSIVNEQEAEWTLKTLIAYIERIGKDRVIEQRITFGIISPYSAQVRLFREKINQYNILKELISRKLITIKTIDGFQGQERDVIAISLVRSNEMANIGFLADYRRLNVAITRAKKKLFLVGDAFTLRHDPFFEDLFSYVQKNGIITDLSENLDNVTDISYWGF